MAQIFFFKSHHTSVPLFKNFIYVSRHLRSFKPKKKKIIPAATTGMVKPTNSKLHLVS